MLHPWHRRIHTVDLNHPSSGFGSEDPTKTPTTHPFWKKYITFHQVMVAGGAGVGSGVRTSLAGASPTRGDGWGISFGLASLDPWGVGRAREFTREPET